MAPLEHIARIRQRKIDAVTDAVEEATQSASLFQKRVITYLCILAPLCAVLAYLNTTFIGATVTNGWTALAEYPKKSAAIEAHTATLNKLQKDVSDLTENYRRLESGQRNIEAGQREVLTLLGKRVTIHREK